MSVRAPHFVLVSELTRTPPQPGLAHRQASPRGWRFVLRSEDGATHLDVSDSEPDASPERLELLAVVRGLEALEQPSRVTLVTSCGWVRRGLRFGLDAWRDNHWQWERFGQMTQVKYADLWQRIDHALRFHDVDCRTVRRAPAADDLAGPQRVWEFHPPHPIKEGASLNPDRRCGATAGGPLSRQLISGVLRLMRRLFGWCHLGRGHLSLVIATE
jgi:ribonuclease HI